MHGSDSKQYSKGLENGAGARQPIGMGYIHVPDWPLAGTHTRQIQIAVPSLLKMTQQNHSPQKAGQNLRPKPNRVNYLLKQTNIQKNQYSPYD